MAVSVPKFRVPFEVVNGSVALVEQDSEREIAQCVHAVLSTPIGSRIEVPEFGRPARLFKQQGGTPNADTYLAAAEKWEPRAPLIARTEIEEMVERISVRTGVDDV